MTDKIVSKPKHRSIEIIQSEKQREDTKQKINRVTGMSGAIKKSSKIQVPGAPKREEKENGAENVF